MRGKLKAKRGGWWSEKRDEEAKKGYFSKNRAHQIDPVIKNQIDGVWFVIQRLICEPVSAGAVPLRGMGCGAEGASAAAE
jgi:hypothetical protein